MSVPVYGGRGTRIDGWKEQSYRVNRKLRWAGAGSTSKVLCYSHREETPGHGRMLRWWETHWPGVREPELPFLDLVTKIFFFFFFWLHRDTEACRILVPWPGAEPRPLAMKAPNRNHWTAKEVSKYSDCRPQGICGSPESSVPGREDHVSMWLWVLSEWIFSKNGTQHNTHALHLLCCPLSNPFQQPVSIIFGVIRLPLLPLFSVRLL